MLWNPWGGREQLRVGLDSLLYKTAGHENKSGCPKHDLRNTLHLFLYLCICLFTMESEYKFWPKFHKRCPFHSIGSVLLVVFLMRIKLLAEIIPGKIQILTNRFLCCCVGVERLEKRRLQGDPMTTLQ